MTREARLISRIILITVPTIQYGGYFLLTSLMNKNSAYLENPLRQNFFRAGHAHAGVIVLLSLLCQMLADSATLPISLLWSARIAVPFAAVLILAGFFFSVLPPTANSNQRCGLPDLPWSCSCRSRRFTRHWVGQSCIVRPPKESI